VPDPEPISAYTGLVATAQSTVSHARGRVATAVTFERAALATLALLWLVVTSGGLVRLTASGLGCPHWPTCDAGSLVPSTGYHAVIEFTNRVISGIAMVAAVITAWIGFRTPGLRRPVAWAAAAAAAGTVAQVPLGAVTVALDLNPWLVMSHFLLAMAVVAVSSWVAFHAVDFARGGRHAVLRWSHTALLGAAGVVLYLALVSTGALVTAAGPHPGSTTTPIERIGNFYDATWLHVRAAAAFSIALLLLVGLLWRRARGTAVQRLSIAVMLLTLCQFGVGEYQYRNGLPWQVIAVHIAIAATLLVGVVIVATMVAYPPDHRLDERGSLERV
jgi:cytochrome c oxidase assembly protein subunit 15